MHYNFNYQNVIQKLQMAGSKHFLKLILEGFFTVIWGINIIDIFNQSIFKSNAQGIIALIEDSTKLGFAILGIIFFIKKIAQYDKECKQKNETKRLDIQNQQLELDIKYYELEERKLREKNAKRNESNRNSIHPIRDKGNIR